MATFDAGSWVWTPDEEEGFLPGQVVDTFAAGEAGVVMIEGGNERVELTASQTKDLVAMDVSLSISAIASV